MRSQIAQAIALTEDRRFYVHWGIDPIGIARAFLVNLAERRYAQGGSTITQQLARTLYLHKRKTLLRKFLEVFAAFYLELRWSKDKIMEKYMAEVYMGQKSNGMPIKGFEQASKYYFKKSLEDTTIAEKAALVAMLKGPNIYGPSTRAGTARRATVLGNMLDGRIITVDEFFRAVRTKL